MPKNIVIYSDGTGQDGGVRPEQTISNVYKMYRASRTSPDNPIDPEEQVAFYDPDLGADIGATALSAPWRFIQKLLASVIFCRCDRSRRIDTWRMSAQIPLRLTWIYESEQARRQ